MMVTGRQSFTSCGAQSILDPFFKNIPHVRFQDYSINPKIEDVAKGIELYKDHKVDFIIAIGGGSAIDMAKLINVLANQTKRPSQYILGKEKISGESNPFIAIPTTAGSGSEVTHFAIMYIDHVKYSLAHPEILPHYALVDPVLTYNLPARITASTGLDALAQGIESLWNVNSTDQSRDFALKSIELVFPYLKTAVETGEKLIRDKISQGALLAGQAINITKTTAPHAFSYPFTSYFSVPHGHAVGLTLPQFVNYNYQLGADNCNDPRGVDFIRSNIDVLFNIMGVKNSDEAEKNLKSYIQNIKLENTLSELNFMDSNWRDRVSSNINIERLQNNPRKVDEEAVKRILDGIN